MRSHPILLASLLLAPVAPTAPSARGQEAAAHHRFLFKEREALDPWPGRIAFRAPDEGSARAAALVAGCTRVEPAGLDGWFLAEGGETALAALSAADDVFALPLFRDHLGGPLFWTETFFVAFDPAVPAELCEAKLEASGAGTIEARDWAGLERT